jgi:hypothetical protein
MPCAHDLSKTATAKRRGEERARASDRAGAATIQGASCSFCFHAARHRQLPYNEKRSSEQLSSTVIASPSKYFYLYRTKECHCHKSRLGLVHKKVQCILNLTECTTTTPDATYPVLARISSDWCLSI